MNTTTWKVRWNYAQTVNFEQLMFKEFSNWIDSAIDKVINRMRASCVEINQKKKSHLSDIKCRPSMENWLHSPIQIHHIIWAFVVRDLLYALRSEFQHLHHLQANCQLFSSISFPNFVLSLLCLIYVSAEISNKFNRIENINSYLMM